jgi:anaerobic selenocysteine-containing dehydrogenase
MTDPDVLTLTTIRSHGQYNTTVYNLDDRYRGVFGRRDVIFMNRQDLTARGLREGDVIDILGVGAGTGPDRKVSGFTAVEYDIPAGTIAAYYPETNPVIARSDIDPQSGTPAYKSAPVTVRLSQPGHHADPAG